MYVPSWNTLRSSCHLFWQNTPRLDLKRQPSYPSVFSMSSFLSFQTLSMSSMSLVNHISLQETVQVMFQILSSCVTALGQLPSLFSHGFNLSFCELPRFSMCCLRIFQTSSSWSLFCSKMTSASSLTFLLTSRSQPINSSAGLQK